MKMSSEDKGKGQAIKSKENTNSEYLLHRDVNYIIHEYNHTIIPHILTVEDVN